MPYTLNGVGTRYYGRRNASQANGTCQSCNRWVALSSYDTRECFCLLFIPVIPLRRFRIRNDCASCRRHYRVPLDAFQQQLEATVDPLREAVRRSPRQPDAHLELVRGLIRFGMLVEAEQAATDAVAQIPNDAPLNLLAGSLAATRGDHAAATPFYRRAASAVPQDAAARVALGGNLLDVGLFDEAARELEAARQLTPDDRVVLSLLAQCYESLSRWGEALDLLERLRSGEAAAATDDDLLARIRKCKQALSYPLSDDERRAGRRWWPWRAKARDAAPAGSVKIGWRPAVLVVGGLVVALAGGASAVAYWEQNHVPVWFDNGLTMPVSVAVDGDAFTLPPGAPLERRLAPGTHAVVVSTDRGELERYQAEVVRQPLWLALDSSDFYVYNVAEAHVYRHEKLGYSADPNLRSHSEVFIGFERFHHYSGVDYVFAPPPASLSDSSSTSVTSKAALTVAADVGYNGLANMRYAEGKREEAEKAVRKALALAPCHANAHRNMVTLLRITGRADEAVSDAQRWIAECPDAGVEAHRAYQDAALAGGGRARLVAEYTERRAQRPSDAPSHYLLGRVMDDPERALAEHQEAIRLDPRLAWAYVALAYNLMALERYPEAAAALTEVLKNPAHDPSTPYLYAVAAVGAGQMEDAAKRLAPVARTHADDESVWNARWLLALALRQWPAANVLLQERSASGDNSPEEKAEMWSRRVELLRAQRLFSDLDPLLASAASPKPHAAIVRFERLMEEGRYAEAAAWFDQALAKEPAAPSIYRLYAAAGLLLGGERRVAAQRLQAAVADGGVSDGKDVDDSAFAALAAALGGRGSDEDVLRTARQGHFMRLKHAYFLLGARAAALGDVARARRLFQSSARACLDLGFPLEAAQRAVGGRP
jgi:tetratricopeptide (TPR) repeat protein